VSLGSGLQLLVIAVGLYVVTFVLRQHCRLFAFCYYVGCLSFSECFCGLGVKCSIDYFVLRVITQIINHNLCSSCCYHKCAMFKLYWTTDKLMLFAQQLGIHNMYTYEGAMALH
jgi:hypothetical protein